MAEAKPKRGRERGGGAERILEAALGLAEQRRWYDLSLADVACAASVTVAEVHRHYRDLDAVADAWFASARDAMAAPEGRRFHQIEPRERIRILFERWFDALAPRRRVTRDILRARMHPPHPHHWVPMVFHLSRLIQLVRDMAGLRATGRRRQVEEAGLTLLFLAALRVWCRDESADQARTRRFLDRRLGAADRIMAGLYGRRRP